MKYKSQRKVFALTFLSAFSVDYLINSESNGDSLHSKNNFEWRSVYTSYAIKIKDIEKHINKS